MSIDVLFVFFLVTEGGGLNRTASEERVAARSGMNGPAGGTAAASDGDNNDVHLSRKWRDDRWLKEHEGTGLTEANVLDYFALSEW